MPLKEAKRSAIKGSKEKQKRHAIKGIAAKKEARRAVAHREQPRRVSGGTRGCCVEGGKSWYALWRRERLVVCAV